MSFRRPPSDVERMTSLRVGNLPFRAHSEDLLPLFEKYGDVGDVYIPLERGSGRSRGFAFVRYYDKRDAESHRRCQFCWAGCYETNESLECETNEK